MLFLFSATKRPTLALYPTKGSSVELEQSVGRMEAAALSDLIASAQSAARAADTALDATVNAAESAAATLHQGSHMRLNLILDSVKAANALDGFDDDEDLEDDELVHAAADVSSAVRSLEVAASAETRGVAIAPTVCLANAPLHATALPSGGAKPPDAKSHLALTSVSHLANVPLWPHATALSSIPSRFRAY